LEVIEVLNEASGTLFCFAENSVDHQFK
jgi:hypothetical protein